MGRELGLLKGRIGVRLMATLLVLAAAITAVSLMLAGRGSSELRVEHPESVDPVVVDKIIESFLTYSNGTLGREYERAFAVTSRDCLPPLTLERFSTFHSRNNDLVLVMFGVEPAEFQYSSIEVLSVVDGRAEVDGEFRPPPTPVDLEALGLNLRDAAPPQVLVEQDGAWLVDACALATAQMPAELDLGR